MADFKLTELTAITAPDEADILYLVSDPAGTPTSKKVTVANLLKFDYGQIYVASGAVAQSLGGVAYEKVTGFAANGLSNNVTADAANDKLTIDDIGVYRVAFNVAFSGGNSVVYTFAPYWNGVAQTQIKTERKMGIGGDIGSCSAVGYIDVTVAGTDVDLRVISDSATTLTLKYGQLIVEKVG